MNAETGIAPRTEKLRLHQHAPIGVLLTTTLSSSSRTEGVRPSREQSVFIRDFRIYLRQMGMGGWVRRQNRK